MSDVTDTVKAAPRAKVWSPELDVVVADVLRHLMVHPWLVAGRDDDMIAKVRLHADALRDALSRLGWVLVIERDLVRLRKSPPPRRDAYAAGGPNARTCQWFFLLVAAAESMGRRVGLGALVTAARAAAAEAGVAVTGDIGERRAIIAAIKALSARGVLEELDGDLDGYLVDDDPPVLLEVHHTRLLHVIANYSGDHDPVDDPAGWLDDLEREPEPARRMRRRLVDDTVVHVCDLDDAETDWLSRRLRDDGGALAAAFGLLPERRTEGAAFVVSSEHTHPPARLGPLPFPGSGTVAHAALLLCNWACAGGGVDDDTSPSGWRRVSDAGLVAALSELADGQQAGTGGWSRDLAADPGGRLRAEVLAFLEGLDLVRADGDDWLFSPAVARWPAPTRKITKPKAKPAATPTLFDSGGGDDADLG